MKDPERLEAVISQQMTVSGDIVFRGVLRIDGIVEGSLRGERVVLGPTARLSGHVVLRELDCAGDLEGQIQVERLLLQSSGRVTGTVIAGELVVQTGAFIDGQLSVGTVQDLAATVSRLPGPHVSELPEGDHRIVGEALDRACEQQAAAKASGDEALVASLVDLLRRDGRLVVVVSDRQQRRELFCRLSCAQLASHFRVVSLPDPSGSLRDLLGRIAERLGIVVSDEDDPAAGWQKIHSSCAGTGAPPLLLFVENGEMMFPATLEGLLRLLGDTGAQPAPPLVLSGSTDLRKFQEIAAGGASLHEPDCLFELPVN